MPTPLRRAVRVPAATPVATEATAAEVHAGQPAPQPPARSRRQLARTLGAPPDQVTPPATGRSRHPQLRIELPALLPPSPAPVFQSQALLSLELTLPMRALVAQKDAWVAQDKAGPAPTVEQVALQIDGQAAEVSLKVRGNSSLADYAWPKLGLKALGAAPPALEGLRSVNLLNHTRKQWEDVAEKLPWRESAAYAVLEGLGVPTLKARACRVVYRDNSGGRSGRPQTHSALLVENDKDAARRYGGKSIDLSAQAVIDPPVHISLLEYYRFELAQRLLGNDDCQLITGPATKEEVQLNSLWNYDAIELPAQGAAPARMQLLASDFDRSYFVFAPQAPFKAQEFLSWIEQAYWRDPEVFLGAARSLLAQKKGATRALAKAPLDDADRPLLAARLKAFFTILDKFVKKPTPPPSGL